MLRSLLGITKDLAQWHEAPPWRIWQTRDDPTYFLSLLASDLAELGEGKLGGRRACELAAGSLPAFTKDIIDLQRPILLECLASSQLSLKQSTDIMADFGDGSRHLICMVTVKFSFWQDLPHKLFGLAHAHEDVARKVAQEVLSLRQVWLRKLESCTSESSRRACSHPCTLLWLADDSPLLPQASQSNEEH